MGIQTCVQKFLSALRQGIDAHLHLFPPKIPNFLKKRDYSTFLDMKKIRGPMPSNLENFIDRSNEYF